MRSIINYDVMDHTKGEDGAKHLCYSNICEEEKSNTKMDFASYCGGYITI